MVENEAGSSEAEESRDNPSSEVTPKGVSALLDSDEAQRLASLNKSSRSSRKSPRLDLSAQSTARKDIVNATEAKVPEAPKLHPASGSLSDQTPSDKSTATETNLIDPFPSRDPLTSLPLELLGEILIHTRSTKDILRVTRCSKHFWKTLTAPSAAFIWKKARVIAFPIPMPDPPSVLSEYAYASMVYGGGKCEICSNNTNEMHCSFTFRFRVCRDKACRLFDPAYRGFTKLQKNINPDSVIWERMPMVGDEIYATAVCEDWRHSGLWCRTTERKNILAAYQRDNDEFKATGDFDEFQRKHQDAIKKNKEWMAFCATLSQWKDGYLEQYKDVKRKNEVLAKEIAKRRGFNLMDLLNETSYGALHHLRNRCFQMITWNDFTPLEPKVKEELYALAEKRKRRQRVSSYDTIYNAIQKCHSKLRNEMQSSDHVVPPFPTFRRFPVFVSLLSLADVETSNSIQDILKRSSVRDVVKAEMTKWETEAKKQLAEILGCSEYGSKSENEGEPHPDHSWMAWFLCKHCTAQAIQSSTAIKPLRFRDVCQHECPVRKGQRRKNDLWDALNFIKDEKAISVLEKCASLHKYDAPKSSLIKCLSCQPYAIITLNNVVSHCHRHDDMEIDRIQSINDLESLNLITTYGVPTPGLAKKLVARTNVERDLKDCGCRSCLLETAQKHPEFNQKELLAEQRKMSINGLRSHLKAKHGIQVLYDDDVFKFPTSQ